MEKEDKQAERHSYPRAIINNVKIKKVPPTLPLSVVLPNTREYNSATGRLQQLAALFHK